MDDLKMKEKEEKSRKEEFKKRKGQEMRAAAVNKMFSKLYASMCISHWKG
jgi:hypothetical protein